MVFASFDFKCCDIVTVFFVFNTDYTVNVPLYAISVRIELLFRSNKVVVLETELVLAAQQYHIEPLSNVFDTSLRINNNILLFFL